MEMVKQNVLIVDDDPDVRTVLQIFLDLNGYASETAENGYDGLTKLTHTNYDAVILDYMLPGMNGLSVLRHIQQHVPFTPVVMLTGHTDSEVAAEALTEGAKACLFKPFDCVELRQVLECSVGVTP